MCTLIADHYLVLNKNLFPFCLAIPNKKLYKLSNLQMKILVWLFYLTPSLIVLFFDIICKSKQTWWSWSKEISGFVIDIFGSCKTK